MTASFDSYVCTLSCCCIGCVLRLLVLLLHQANCAILVFTVRWTAIFLHVLTVRWTALFLPEASGQYDSHNAAPDPQRREVGKQKSYG